MQYLHDSLYKTSLIKEGGRGARITRRSKTRPCPTNLVENRPIWLVNWYGTRMPRMTTAEIRAEIVDRAASLFSRHGFAQTSLQQVADAVGYTKAGLLHHFPSKQSIYDATVEAVTEQLAGVALAVESLPAGESRDLAVVTAMVDLTAAWPGVSEFANSLVRDGGDVGPELERGGLALLGAFAVDLENADDRRFVRIVSACSGLTASTLLALQADRAREWRELIIRSSMDTLGHSALLSAAIGSVPPGAQQ